MPFLRASSLFGRHSRASADAEDDTSDPPPSYDEATRQGSAQASTHATSDAQSQRPPSLQASVPEGTSNQSPIPFRPSSQRIFPGAFNVYVLGGWDRCHYLGENQESLLYALRLHRTGFSRLPPIVLHSGLDGDETDMWADVDYHWLGQNATIGIPPLPGRDDSADRTEELMTPIQGDGWYLRWRFSIEVGGENSRFREEFEWRHSAGDVVQALDGERGGWKLVRLETGVPQGVDAVQFTTGEGENRSTDGYEVVAVWTEAAYSVKKCLKFEFLGSGLAGVLGERWALMAVMTGLAIWDQDSSTKRHWSLNRI